MEDQWRKMRALIDGAGLACPGTVTLMLTNQCNLFCRHCMPESRMDERSPVAAADAVKRVIDGVARLGATGVCLTGGEPLCHPDWRDILSFACGHPGLKYVCLQTNAVLMTREDMAALKTMDNRKLLVRVSLEGATAGTHDHVRGDGNFDTVIRRLNALSDAGLGRRTGVAFTEMRHNFDELPRLIRILDGMGINGLVSGTLVRKGRAGQSGRIALPEPSQYAALLDRYQSDPGFRRRYRRFANIAALEWFLGKMHPEAAVCRCMATPYINSDGVMFPCTMLAVEALGVGGVFSRPLADCLSEAAGVWAGLNDYHRRRAETLTRCLSCPGRRHCRGGCMGRAHAAFGSFMAVEDRCRLRREVYARTP